MPEVRWDLEIWYKKLLTLLKVAKRFEAGTFSTTQQGILNQVLGLIDYYAQHNQALPQVISQNSLIEIYTLSPSTLVQLTIYPSVIERLSLGNDIEKEQAPRKWRLFKKLLQDKEGSSASYQMKANIDQYVQAPTFLMKLERLASYSNQLDRYERTGSFHPVNNDYKGPDKLEKKRIQLLREQQLFNDESFIQQLTHVKETFYEAAKNKGQEKEKLFQVEQNLYLHLKEMSGKIDHLLNTTASDLHRQRFFSAIKKQPNPVVSFLIDYKKNIRDVMLEIEKKNPQLKSREVHKQKVSF